MKTLSNSVDGLRTELDEFDRTLILAAIDDSLVAWEHNAVAHDQRGRRQLAILRRQMIHDLRVIRRALQIASGTVMHGVGVGPSDERQWTGRLPR